MPSTTDSIDETVDRIVSLTRAIRDAEDQAEQAHHERRRAKLLEAIDRRLHVREDDDGAWVILYPAAWMDDGTVDPDSIDDRTRAIERPVDPAAIERSFEVVDRHNRRVASAVERRFGPTHGETVDALATYLSNHHLTRIGDATPEQLQTFRRDYFIRNAWPTGEQRALVDRSIEYARVVAAEMD